MTEGFIETCARCGEEICKHDICYCDEDHGCSACKLEKIKEKEVQREIQWQRDIVGVLCGFRLEQDKKPAGRVERRAPFERKEEA